MCNLLSLHLETVLISVEGLEIVCSEQAVGSRIYLSHLLEHLGDVGHVQSCFVPFEDSVNLGGIIGNDLLRTCHTL